MKRIIFTIIIAAIGLALGVALPANGQSLQNISSINVDDLSDQQIVQLLQQAQKAGLSDSEVLTQAKNRGMPDSEVNKLQTRIAQVRSKGNTSNTTTGNADFSRRKLNYKPDSTSDTVAVANAFKRLTPPIFGAELFRNKNSAFEPDLKLATPLNYVVGPQDQLNINIYGNSVANWQLDVSPEGNINLPGVGLLNVSGKTMAAATAAIKAKLSASNYAVGRGTDVKVTLGNIRSIKVIMVGQLVKPGTYTLPSLATIFNALYSAGGPNDNGSFRDIELIRNNRIVAHLDIYDFLVKGDQKNNISLQDQDIIRVPTYRVRVNLTGQVKTRALFEVLPGETLQNVLNFAGGFTDTAYTAKIKVTQISDQQLRITDVPESDYANYIPLRGDKYTVEAIIKRFENRVIIGGAVFRPGEYELQKGLTLDRLIKNADGLKEDAFMDRGTITRLKPDNSPETIPFNVKDVITNGGNIILQREDSVHIFSIFDLRDKYQVTINGEVRNPGTFAYASGVKVADLILKAGGLAEGASMKRIEVARRINNGDQSSKTGALSQVFSVNIDTDLKPGQGDFELMPFDIVSVYGLPGYEKQKVVKIEGEVLYPGTYTITNKGEKISDLIKRAGGLTASADVEGGTLKRDNIAILGINKNKSDTASVEQERIDRLNRLKRSYKDSTDNTNLRARNSYVGIDLKSILKSPGSSIDLLVEDGDLVRIPMMQQIVRVNGEVLYPSAVVYSSSKSFKGYVLNAGGFSPRALRSGAYVVYPNGTVKGTSKVLFFNSHPSVKPGSEIFVPTKPEPKGNTLQTVLGLSTGLASIGAIILGIISLHK
jgi:protein involved in polysaccharide export with SLBB domain